METSLPLKVENLFFSYESDFGHSRDFAIADITFELEAGDSLGIIGKNGSGKSTLAKLLSGVLLPDSGQISVSGLVAPLIELGAGFDFEMTAIENIYLYGMLLGIPHPSLRQNISGILEFANLLEFSNDPLRTFSSGMVARLGFSIASFATPSLIIIDEILSVGDQQFSQKSRNRIHELLSSSAACVLISHDFEAIRSMTSKTIWLEDGKIREFGDSIRLTDQYMKTI